MNNAFNNRNTGSVNSTAHLVGNLNLGPASMGGVGLAGPARMSAVPGTMPSLGGQHAGPAPPPRMSQPISTGSNYSRSLFDAQVRNFLAQ